jgi:prevent-host-death family protein
MKFYTAREFREKSSEVWSSENDEDDTVVITVNGKPVALVSRVDSDSLDESLKMIKRVKALMTVSALQKQSLRQGTSSITEDEIDAEIQAVRKGRNT